MPDEKEFQCDWLPDATEKPFRTAAYVKMGCLSKVNQLKELLQD